jgi:hypothetical protein
VSSSMTAPADRLEEAGIVGFRPRLASNVVDLLGRAAAVRASAVLAGEDEFSRPSPQPAPPAIEASGVRTPARIYDLRSTFASNALAAGVSVFQLARIMGTSVRMIERHYGAMLDGSGAEIADRLDAAQERDDEARSEGG